MPDTNFHVVLYQPEIPQNTGNIGRLCLATNSHLHLIKPYGFEIDEKALRRAGLDYWKFVNVSEYDSWGDFKAKNTEAGIICFTTKTQHTINSMSAEIGSYLVFGPETRGLPADIIEGNLSAKIPIYDERVRSLNLANSVAVALYWGLGHLCNFGNTT